ncbi:hypothetical protein ACJZ2D_006001 [Fusarium nematophilum]
MIAAVTPLLACLIPGPVPSPPRTWILQKAYTYRYNSINVSEACNDKPWPPLAPSSCQFLELVFASSQHHRLSSNSRSVALVILAPPGIHRQPPGRPAHGAHTTLARSPRSKK